MFLWDCLENDTHTLLYMYIVGMARQVQERRSQWKEREVWMALCHGKKYVMPYCICVHAQCVHVRVWL